MINKNKTAVYMSIFKRKGGEGIKTKIINESNREQYNIVWNNLLKEEEPLIIYFDNNVNWFLFTNTRIIISQNDMIHFIELNNIIEITPALEEEFKNNIFNKTQFSKLKIKQKNDIYIICDLERGLPFEGLYQVLHFIKTQNINIKKG
ncbi:MULTISPECIES: hypothetical protein [Chryseobacterium]|uniref:hypothetical protein n=1 Tax=Chryseobacterium TaxID=59732 RepID=UPI000482DB1C|nr:MULTISPECIES: hypothetical protein [Chryseobacterium]